MADYPSFPDMIKAPAPRMSQSYLDNTLASMMENGLVMTRPRSGGPLKRTWSVPYTNNPEADRAALDEFIRNTVQGGAGAFYYRDPRPPNDVVLVRFTAGKPPQIEDAGWASLDGIGGGLTYNWTLELQEV